MSVLWERLKSAAAALAGRGGTVSPAASNQEFRAAAPADAAAARSFAAQAESMGAGGRSVGIGWEADGFASLPGATSGVTVQLTEATPDLATLSGAICAHCRRYASDIAAQEVL